MNIDNKMLNDKELETITGGDVTSANIVGTVNPHCRPWPENISAAMPPINPNEKYIMDTKPTADEIIDELKS